MSDFLVSSIGLSGAPRMAVYRAQEELAIAQKEVVTGRYADVGLSMDLTPQAVKSLLSRARKKMRQHLERIVS